MKYFKPLTWQNEDIEQRVQKDNKMRQWLINNFVKTNRSRFKEISDAINTGDIQTAHRLVHTLKSNAGQLNKTMLQHAAEELEGKLANGVNNSTPQQMKTLQTELSAAIAELEPLVYEPDLSVKTAKPLDKKAARKLLEEVGILLINSNVESLNYVDKLRMIPGSDELVRQIENLDFVYAAESIEKLMDKY
jgi:HPt (histidine-containing phosphotransfer) domain-containing protein